MYLTPLIFYSTGGESEWLPSGDPAPGDSDGFAGPWVTRVEPEVAAPISAGGFSFHFRRKRYSTRSARCLHFSVSSAEIMPPLTSTFAAAA